MKRLLRAALPIAAIVLTGCDAVSERECDVFDHPDFALWQPDTGNATLTFRSTGGATKIFNRQSVVLNSPFLGTDGSSNDEDVVCELTATVRMEASDNSLVINSIYTQEEELQIESIDEVLLVDHQLEATVGTELTELTGTFPAEISVDTVRVNFNPTRVQYLDEEQITADFPDSGFEDVIRITALESTSSSTESNSGDFIKEIVMARGFGIVAFTDAEEREFVLDSPE